jgi:hypothetical protein
VLRRLEPLVSRNEQRQNSGIKHIEYLRDEHD